MNSIDKLFLLDAYALIYRAYYAFIKNPRINSKGFNTSAILGFVNTLEEVLKKENPTHIGVAFDPSGPTFRHEAYEQYKAQREETPEAIRLSVPIIKDIIRAYRIPILEVSGYEADDVIGTLATEAGRQGITTYMMTPDKDYGQLVSDRVFMYRPKHTGGFEVMGTEEVKAKFNIQTTEQVIDMLGLMGDASDNIPGCPGVGEKTAQKLIAEFGNQFLCGFLAHTRTAGDVVGSIAHQSQHVDDLLGGLYVEFGFYFFGTHHFESAGVLGAVHEDAVRYQLPVVLVGSHHIGGDALPSGFGGERAYHVVGFVAGYFEDGNAVGADDVLYNRYGKADGLGCLLALCLVLLVGLVAEGGARRVEGYSYVCGILFFEHFFQGVYKAQNGRSVESF